MLRGLDAIWARIFSNGNAATVTEEGYLDVKTHSVGACYSVKHTVDRSGYVIVTPPAGQRIEVIQACVTSKSDDDVEIYFTGASDGRIFVIYPTKKSSGLSAIICAKGEVDQSISLDCGADSFIQFGYNII